MFKLKCKLPLTQPAAEQFDPHGYVAIPTPNIYAHVASNERSKEAMADHIVSLDISLKQLNLN